MQAAAVRTEKALTLDTEDLVLPYIQTSTGPVPINETVSRKAFGSEYDELAAWDAIMRATALSFNSPRKNHRPADSSRWSLASEVALAAIAVLVALLDFAAVVSQTGLSWIPVSIPILAVVVVRGLFAFKRWVLEATPSGTRANVAVAAISSTIVSTVLLVLIMVIGVRAAHL